MNANQTIEQPTPAALAPATGSAAVEREKRQWWAIAKDEGCEVRRVTGYSCAPNSPTYWWVPELGYSMAEGFTLFETEREALDKAIEKLERQIAVAQDNIEALKLRRQNAPGERPGATTKKETNAK